jgi:hypothetical protein
VLGFSHPAQAIAVRVLPDRLSVRELPSNGS